MNDPHFQRLLDLYLDGGLDAEELAEFERVVLSNQQARSAFWEQAHLHEALSRQAGESWGVRAADAGRRQRRAFLRRVTAAAALVAVSLTAWLLVSRPWADPAAGPTAGVAQSTLTPRPAPLLAQVAVLSELADPVWDSPRVLRKGEAIAPGEFALRSGLIGLTFFNGARVTMQGPARWSILTDSSMQLDSGSIRIECPEAAQGFTVFTPSGRVIDLGTVFGLSVSDDGTAEVQVIEGLVAMRGDAEEADTELQERSVAVIDESGRVRHRETAISSAPEGFARQIRDHEQQRFEEWRENSARRAGAADLLVYLRLLDDENSSNRLLLNEGGSKAASATAPVIAADWVEGRWPGKRALLFQSTEDRARIAVDGSYPQATFAAWVQIVGFQRPFNALFMSDKELDGEVHWQFSQSGDFRFSLQSYEPQETRKHHRAWEEDILPPADNGVWRHLATSYDASQKLLIHYLDGREVGRHSLPKSIPLNFGLGTIGNTSYRTKQYWGPRQFGGAVDEFAIFSRVLDPGEIAELYEEGRPD